MLVSKDKATPTPTPMSMRPPAIFSSQLAAPRGISAQTLLRYVGQDLRLAHVKGLMRAHSPAPAPFRVLVSVCPVCQPASQPAVSRHPICTALLKVHPFQRQAERRTEREGDSARPAVSSLIKCIAHRCGCFACETLTKSINIVKHKNK